RPHRVIGRADDVGVPAVKLVCGLSRSGRSGVPLDSWPAAARSGVAWATRMPSGSAAVVLALAWWRLVAGFAGWQATARGDGSAGSHCLPRQASLTRQASVARKARVAGRADGARPRSLARRHRRAGPRRLPGSHVLPGWPGRRRLAAGGIRRPAGTARIHPWLVTRTRRFGSGPPGRRPVLAPPAGRG